MPPAIDAAWILCEIISKQGHVSGDLATLISFVPYVLECDIAEANLQAVTAANLIGAILHALVDHPTNRMRGSLRNRRSSA